MTEFAFETATKDQAKARIALAGPSGSGKTWTALAIAVAFGGRPVVFDTERGSASKYADLFAFDRLNMTNYDPRDLTKALGHAGKAAYPTVIVDSLSKFWSGQGGMLEQVDSAAKRGYGGNNIGGWKEARPMENAMIDALLGYPGHVIVTMRTKTAYEVVEDERGRKVPTKLGMKPEQREGIEYEFDIVGDMDQQNALTVSKTRCPALAGKVVQRPDSEFAETILAWLTDGKPAKSANDYRDDALSIGMSYGDLLTLHQEVKGKGLLGAMVTDNHDETVSLEALIKRLGTEARQAERGHSAPVAPATSEPEAAAASQAAPHAVPAGSATSGTDYAWLADLTETRIPQAQTNAALTKYRREVANAITAGTCTQDDGSKVTEQIDEREAELAQVRAA